jgi:hypothetical protein
VERGVVRYIEKEGIFIVKKEIIESPVDRSVSPNCSPLDNAPPKEIENTIIKRMLVAANKLLIIDSLSSSPDVDKRRQQII